ncbi:MAG: RnfABCDGE type electron transport complex subunit D [Candidatus Omnitrophica bacterium]|nr:RnfABCDGE type electron transport complex subunit D [Candidatus Omnitrophota bacterium]MDD5429711.1 RnfABCDGE type electron transport complex subunit D [Candidatus Omnitrophota bacterium]
MLLKVNSSPHLNQPLDTRGIMIRVAAALIPAVAASIYFFGLAAIRVIIICVSASILTEAVIMLLRKKKTTLGDCSALVTGLLLALILPPQTTGYAAIIGSVFAIAIGKQIFGGLGSNIFNPALIARAFLMAAYPKMLTTFASPRSVDAVSSATPLALRKFSHNFTPLWDLFTGKVSGSLGETSAICLIIGGAYLLIKKIADWRLSLSMLSTVTLIAFIAVKINPINGSVLFHLFSGGLLLGAFFMATDPVTTPATKKGRYIFGTGCGILIMIIRYFSGLPEGVMYSILFMNALTPSINRYTHPRPFGNKASGKGEK